MGDEASLVAIRRIDQTINRLRENGGKAGCASHGDISDALVILLECQKDRISESQQMIRRGSWWGAFAGGVVSVVVVVVKWLAAELHK